MHILHLEASAGWGGQEMRILREAQAMEQRGHRVIFGVMRRGLLIDKACKAGFTVYSLPFQKIFWPLCLIQLLFILYKHKIQLVNTHSSLDSWIGGIPARIARVPILRTRHLSTPIKIGWNSRVLYGALADFVVTTCASILPMIRLGSGKTEQQSRSIPTGVDLDQVMYDPALSVALRTRLGISPDDFLVGTACFMRSWKGISDLLHAANLLRNHTQIKWLIIGGGHARTYIQQAHDLHLHDTVFFTGHLEDPLPAIGALDAFTLLSTANEGVSQAILQAASLKKPLISTATGGLGEVCIDQNTGIQVPPSAPQHVANAVLALQNSPSLCSQFGLNGAALVKKQFTFAHTINEMEEVYKKITDS